MVDLKDMDPLICILCITLEDDTKPTRQMQHMLNLALKEVVKAEVLNLLDAGIIYPTVDSKWASLTKVVPKRWVAVVRNEDR